MESLGSVFDALRLSFKEPEETQAVICYRRRVFQPAV